MQNCKGSVYIDIDEIEARELAEIVSLLKRMVSQRRMGGDKASEEAEAAFKEKFPELLSWAKALASHMIIHDLDFTPHDEWLGDGLHFCDNDRFEPDYVAEIVQLAVQRYGIPEISFDYVCDIPSGEEDPEYICGFIVRVDGKEIETTTTKSIIEKRWGVLIDQDLGAAAQMGDLERFRRVFDKKKALLSEEDMEIECRNALKVAIRREQREVFNFLLENGFHETDSMTDRLLESRPYFRAALDAAKLAGSMGNRCASSRISRHAP